MTTASTSKIQPNTKGYLIAIIAALILSTTAILIRILTDTYQMPPLILAFWRNLVTFSFLSIVLFFFKPNLLRFPSNQFKYLLGFGLILTMFNALWTTAVSLTGAALSTVLAYTSGAFTALLGRWLLKEQLYFGKIIAIVLSFGGIVMVSGVLGESSMVLTLGGVLTGVFSGLMYAAYSLMGRSASQRQLNPWTTLLYTFGFATVYLFISNTLLAKFIPGTAQNFSEMFWLGKTWQGWAILVALAIGPTLTGYGAYNISLGYLPSSSANLILTMEPAFTALIAFFLLGERLTALEIIGSLVIMTSVIFLRLKAPKNGKGIPIQSGQTAVQ